MIILVDVDDVCLDCVSRWLEMYNATAGTSFTRDDVHDWEFSGLNLNREVLYGLLWHEDFYPNAKAIPDALDAIRFLRLLGHRVVYVTSSNPVSARAKMEWLSNHGFLIGKGAKRFDDVVICHDKSLIKGDVLVDDAVHNLETSGAKVKILFDQPHNRAFVANGFTRCLNWQEVVKAIVKLGG